MQPPLLLLHPQISRSLVQYRYDRMDGAETKALSYDPPFAGTMFPWESAFSGEETCPTCEYLIKSHAIDVILNYLKIFRGIYWFT